MQVKEKIEKGELTQAQGGIALGKLDRKEKKILKSPTGKKYIKTSQGIVTDSPGSE